MAAGAKETKEDKTRRGQKDYPIKGQNMPVLVPPGQTAEFIQSYKGQQGGRHIAPLKVNESQEWCWHYNFRKKNNSVALMQTMCNTPLTVITCAFGALGARWASAPWSAVKDCRCSPPGPEPAAWPFSARPHTSSAASAAARRPPAASACPSPAAAAGRSAPCLSGAGTVPSVLQSPPAAEGNEQWGCKNTRWRTECEYVL